MALSTFGSPDFILYFTNRSPEPLPRAQLCRPALAWLLAMVTGVQESGMFRKSQHIRVSLARSLDAKDRQPLKMQPPVSCQRLCRTLRVPLSCWLVCLALGSGGEACRGTWVLPSRGARGRSTRPPDCCGGVRTLGCGSPQKRRWPQGPSPFPVGLHHRAGDRPSEVLPEPWQRHRAEENKVGPAGIHPNPAARF